MRPSAFRSIQAYNPPKTPEEREQKYRSYAKRWPDNSQDQKENKPDEEP